MSCWLVKVSDKKSRGQVEEDEKIEYLFETGWDKWEEDKMIRQKRGNKKDS